MGLDPQCEAVLKGMEGSPAIEEMSVEEARAAAEGFTQLMGPPEPVKDVVDRTLPGPAGEIPVKIYSPSGKKPLPVLLYFHGGLFFMGSPDVVDPVCRGLANRGRCVVVAVGYRLAPEDPFPAALEDCYAATAWVSEHAREIGGDPRSIAVGGDSAGGNLAAVVTLTSRDRGGPALAYQMLFYPMTDSSCEQRSYQDFASGYLLHADAVRKSWDRYLDGADGSQPYVSPMRAPDLSGLPPAFVATCEFDPLRDEGEDYAARLKAAGVACETLRCVGAIHGVLWMAGVVDRARELLDTAGASLRKALGSA